MAFVIVYIITILMSLGIDCSILGEMCKDLADMLTSRDFSLPNTT